MTAKEKDKVPEGCYEEEGKGRKLCSNSECGWYIGARQSTCPACGTDQPSKGKGKSPGIPLLPTSGGLEFAGAVKALTQAGGLKGLKMHISRVESVQDSMDALHGFGGLVNAKAFLIALEGHHRD